MAYGYGRPYGRAAKRPADFGSMRDRELGLALEEWTENIQSGRIAETRENVAAFERLVTEAAARLKSQKKAVGAEKAEPVKDGAPNDAASKDGGPNGSIRAREGKRQFGKREGFSRKKVRGRFRPAPGSDAKQDIPARSETFETAPHVPSEAQPAPVVAVKPDAEPGVSAKPEPSAESEVSAKPEVFEKPEVSSSDAEPPAEPVPAT